MKLSVELVSLINIISSLSDGNICLIYDAKGRKHIQTIR